MTVSWVDLPDERRGAKTWLPESDLDVTERRVVVGPVGLPECVLHGAMNRVDPHAQIWRCSQCGVGAQAGAT